MKPIRLIMSAFGPYKDVVEVNFEQFDDLFLITGKTGHGKTFIYDGICYALYGCTSGKERNDSNLRCNIAEDATPTYVELFFEHQGSTYRIKRNPEYERRSRRGGGTTTEKGNVEFQKENETPVEGPKRVDGKGSNIGCVKELLCLDYEQFKQVMMIAQGEFKELLNAKTKERTLILRSLFNTGCYDKMALKLKDKMDANLGAKKNAERAIALHFRDVKYDDSTPEEGNEDIDAEEFTAYRTCVNDIIEFNNKLDDAKSIWNVDQMLELIDRLTDLENVRLDRLNEKKDVAADALDEATKVFNNAKDNNDYLDAVKNWENDLATLHTKKDEIAGLQKRLEIEKKASRIIKPEYDKCYKANVSLKQNRENLGRRNAESEEANRRLDAANSNYEKIVEENNDIDELKIKSQKINEQKDKYEERDSLKKKVSELRDKSDSIEKEIKKIDLADEELKEKIGELQESVSKFKGSDEKLQPVREALGRYNALKGSIEHVLSNVPEVNKKSENVLKAQGKFVAVRQAYEEAYKIYSESERKLECCRAGILASSLKMGDNCPVCGTKVESLDNIAKLPEDFVTEDQVKELNDKLKKVENQKNLAASDAESANTSLMEVMKSIAVQMIRCLTDYSKLDAEYMDIKNSNNKGISDLISIAIDELDDYKSPEVCEVIKNHYEELYSMVRIISDKVSDKCGELTNSEAVLSKEVEDYKKYNDALAKAQGEETQTLADRRQKFNSSKLNADIDYSTAKAKYEALTELEYDNWEKASAELNIITDKIKSKEDKVKSADNAKAEAKKQVDELSGQLEALKRQYTELKSDFENAKRAMVQAVRESALDEQFVINESDIQSENFFELPGVLEVKGYFREETDLNSEESRVNEYNNKLKLVTYNLETARKKAEGREYIDIVAAQAKVEAHKEVVDRYIDSINSIANRISSNIEKRDNIINQRAVLDDVLSKYNVSAKMYNLISGAKSGEGSRKMKLTFEQYIQARGFDNIIAAANHRLMPMSENQFELVRQTGSYGARSDEFLNLDVIDHFSGKINHVGSLSGGESFKASLSLALGLSDTITASMGGTQIDALFIDEGFGTLDGESLTVAINTLINLASNNKLVGIISHREELIQEIDDKLLVTKDHNGSRIEVQRAV